MVSPNALPVEPIDDPAQMTLADVSALMANAAYAKSRIAELERTRDMEISRIHAWYLNTSEIDRKVIAEAEAQIEQWMRRRLATLQDGDKKSITTPYGSVETLKLQPDYVKDDEALLEWAQRQDLIRVVPESVTVDWVRIKREATIDDYGRLRLHGHIVPGVEVVPREPKVTVKIDQA